MAHRVVALILMSLLVWPSVANDVTVDVNKLTHFTTTFTTDIPQLEGDLHLPPGPIARDFQEETANMHLQGKLIADVTGGKFKLKIEASTAAPSAGWAGHGTYVLTFDASAGYAAFEEFGSGSYSKPDPYFNPYHLTGADGSGCLKVNFDNSMFPPSAQVRTMIQHSAGQADRLANAMPHVVEGGLAYYKDPDVGFALRANDGTPAALWIIPPHWRTATLSTFVEQAQHHPPILSFTPFTAVEAFADVTCPSSASTVEMLAKPSTQQALLVAEQVLSRLQDLAPIQSVTSHIVAHAPQMIRNAGNTPMCQASEEVALADTPADQFGFVGIVALGMLSAIVGAGFVLIAARLVSGKKPETGYMQLA